MTDKLTTEQRLEILETKVSYLLKLLEIPEFAAGVSSKHITDVDLEWAREEIKNRFRG